MLADGLKQILAAEYEAEQVKQLIIDKSKETIEQIKIDGEKAIVAARERAENELTELRKSADQKAMKEAADLASSTANRLATMHARSEKRLDLVAERIYERIVNV